MEEKQVYIAEIYLDQVNRQLVLGDEKRQLEPKVFQLLSTLVAANGNLVSREQLIETVWQGRIVGEGAINRTVSLLRQHLAHFAPATEFIKTVPKAGYKLLHLQIHLTTETSQPKKSPFTFWHKLATATLGILLMVVLSYQIFFKTIDPLEISIHSIKRVTATPGLEYNVTVDASGSELLFNQYGEFADESRLYLHHLASNDIREITNVASYVFQQALSPDGTKMALAFQQDESCHIAIYSMENKENDVFASCALDSFPRFTWHSNGQDVFFRDRKDKTQPYTISRYNLNTKRLTMLTLPASHSNVRGDYLLAHHPTDNKLVVVRYLDEQLTRLIILDSYTGEQLSSMDLALHIDAIDWLTQDHIVVAQRNKLHTVSMKTGEVSLGLARQNQIASLAVAQSQLFYSTLERVNHVVRYNLINGDKHILDNAKAVAQLPRISAQGTLAYLSNKTGTMLLHVKNQAEESSAIKNLPIALYFDRFEWSANGESILLSKKGAIYQFNLNNNRFEQLVDESAQAYVVNYGEHAGEVIYSSNVSGQWQLWRLNIATGSRQQLTAHGGYSGRLVDKVLYFTKIAQTGLWQLDLRTGEESLLIADVDIINWLNWQWLNERIYYYQPGSGIWRFDINSKLSKLVLKQEERFLHQFAVSADESAIYVVENVSLEGDVYQATIQR